MENTRGTRQSNEWIKRVAGGAILLFATVLFFGMLYGVVRYWGMRPLYASELGRPCPEADVFFKTGDAQYAVAPQTTLGRGLHRLVVHGGGRERRVWLWVRDTTPPYAVGTERTISTLDFPTPANLIEGLTDADDRIKVSFFKEPPFGTVGDWDVEILLEDSSGNRSSVVSAVSVRVVRDTVTCEAGSDVPAPEAFLLDNYRVESMTEIDERTMRTPGEHPIAFVIDGMRYESVLRIVDTTAPLVTVETVFCEPNGTLLPEAFLKEVIDETAWTAAFVKEPDLAERNFQTVRICVTDAGGNAVEVEAGLLLTHAKPILVEARTEPLTAEECLNGVNYETATLIKDFVPNTIGTFAVSLQVSGAAEIALVEVVDTTPPVLTAGAVQGYLFHPLEAEQLCTVSDVSPVTVRCTTEVDWTKRETQRVGLLAVDAAGNEARAEAMLTLIEDVEPPVLYGVKTRYFYVDDAVSYLEGVAAIDAADGEVPVRVDTSGVQPNRAGQYAVTYSAEDSAGNAVSARALVVFRKAKVSAQQLEKYTKRIMERITTEDMSLADKVFAIYDYCYNNVRYAARSDKGDWRSEALRAIKKGRGDCFTSNSLARALLELTDAEVVSVQRKSFNTNHYWLFVNVGTGWYHFDATNSREHGYKCRMWTDAQCSIMRGFWVYEKSVCPPVAVERFDREKAAAVEADWTEQHRTGTENGG